MAKPHKKKPTSKVEARLKALEGQVETLSGLILGNSQSTGKSGRSKKKRQMPKAEKFWALEHIQQHQQQDGGVMFAGYVTLPAEETYAWQIESQTNELLQANWSPAQLPLAALAHPVRLSILKAILCGQRDTQALQALPEMGTTGQLYHHLKELESAGWIRQPRRGQYILLAERVVPLLAIMAACEVTDRK